MLVSDSKFFVWPVFSLLCCYYSLSCGFKFFAKFCAKFYWLTIDEIYLKYSLIIDWFYNQRIKLIVSWRSLLLLDNGLVVGDEK